MNLDPQVSDLLSTQTQALNKMRRRLSNNQEVVYNEITREVMWKTTKNFTKATRRIKTSSGTMKPQSPSSIINQKIWKVKNGILICR